MRIYKIINTVNGKIYIGQTKKSLEERFKKHKINAEKHINRYLYDAINHYGVDKFIIELVEDNIDDTNIDLKEIYWINYFKSKIPNGYNMTDGGGGGFTTKYWTEKQRKELWRKQGNKRRGHVVSEKTRLKISCSQKGKIVSKETRDKISITRKLRGIKPKHKVWEGQIGKNHPMWGKHHNQYSREKMSLARKGKPIETIIGQEAGIRYREYHRQQFIGSNNPKWIEKPSKLELMNLWKILLSIQLSFNEIKNLLNKSGYITRKVLHEHGILNYQKFCKLSKQERVAILTELIYEAN